MEAFKELDDLACWLSAAGVDLSLWRSGTSKTLANLWEEYQRGEVLFRNNPPVRMVEVVNVRVTRDDLLLIEIEQEFINGERRARNQPPSEKMKPGEDVWLAARRCLHEELGVSVEQIEWIDAAFRKEEEQIESPSYPGLMTHYTSYTVEAHVRGLPQERFWRENLAAVEGDPVKRHLWTWVRQI